MKNCASTAILGMRKQSICMKFRFRERFRCHDHYTLLSRHQNHTTSIQNHHAKLLPILPHIANRNLSIQENDGSTSKPAFSRISTCGYKYSHDYSIFQSDASRINKTPPDRLKRKFFKRSHFRRKCKLFPRLLKN